MPLKRKQSAKSEHKVHLTPKSNRKNSISNSKKGAKRRRKNSNRENIVVKDHKLVKEETLPLANSSETSLLLPYKNKEIPAVLSYADSDLSHKSWVILTHGAGGDLTTPQLKAITLFLTANNFAVLRFTCKGLNIQYRVNVFHEVLNSIETQFNPRNIFLGGRSMGARAAVTLLSQKLKNTEILDKISGVICLSYPLHKVNETSELRDTVLLELKKPIFFLSGDIDEMCHKHILEKVIKKMAAPYKVHWLCGYDHSAKSKNNFQEDAYLKAFNEIVNWCRDVE